MNRSSNFVFFLQRMVLLFSIVTGHCVAQQVERAPSLPSASNLSVHSGGLESAPAIGETQLEFPQFPFLYFPLGAFEENLQLSTYKENWYSQVLVAMGEPSLLSLGKSTDTRAYRFLLILNHRALSFRLMLNADGTGNLKKKVC